MNKFELTPAFLIGHKKIDSDHAELVNILNEMIDGFRRGDAAFCQEKWQQFCVMLKQHFREESRIMRDFGFVDIDHEEDHKNILARLNIMENNDNSLDNWEACLFEMRNDFLSTILKHDLKFAEYLITIGYNEARNRDHHS